MPTDKPKFNSKLLQESFNKVSPDIDGHLQNLDAISADIKALEAYLEKSGFRFRAEYELPGDGVYREWLYWAEEAKSGRWRIMLNGAWDPEACDCAMITPGEGEYRPLIETSGPKRLFCYDHLPKFLEEVASMVRVKERINLPT